MTSKLQVTIPRAVARQVGIKPGDQLEWTGLLTTIAKVGRFIPSTRSRTSRLKFATRCWRRCSAK
ncbi:MAG: AbrB/MazE/SpoVT family DNA-binding domain-containing protein [Chloroflexi bacterium]|nr:AbrB/MazE/SpoVT family DNA-binding domain-containing protein [Chloroflexota bacterium]